MEFDVYNRFLLMTKNGNREAGLSILAKLDHLTESETNT